MPRWQDRVEELLYDGETIERQVDVDTASVVVTSHRVLAFTPEMSGENLRQVDRPNVIGLERSSLTEDALLARGLRISVWAILLLGAGALFDFGSLIGGVNLTGQGTDELGVGGTLEGVQRMLDLLALLDELLLVAGAIAAFAAVAALGVFWYRRTPTLAITVAGGEDVHVPRPSAGDQEVLEDALAGGGRETQAPDAPTKW